MVVMVVYGDDDCVCIGDDDEDVSCVRVGVCAVCCHKIDR